MVILSAGIFLIPAADIAFADTVYEKQPAFTEKEVPVVRNEGRDGTVMLRFYEDMPNVAYVSAADFQGVMWNGETADIIEQGEGIYHLTNQDGCLIVNSAAGTIQSDDLIAYFGHKRAYDTGLMRLTAISTESLMRRMRM